MRMAVAAGEGEGISLGATSTAAGAGGWAPRTGTGSTGALAVPVLHADWLMLRTSTSMPPGAAGLLYTSMCTWVNFV